MKAKIEYIEPTVGNSFSIKKYCQQFLYRKADWHMHPEYEIVYVSDGKGQRHIGNHISSYDHGDLIMLGPNLPHFGFTQKQEHGHYEIVVQMKEDFLGETFLNKEEMAQIRHLLDRSRTGLSFHGKTRSEVGLKLLKMYKARPFDRLIGLLEVLQMLATSEESESLNASGFVLDVAAKDEDRLQNVYQFVRNNFQEQITLDEMADLTHLTVPSFCRFFKDKTKKTFTQFVNEVRVRHATTLLSSGDMLITDVAMESGFNNLSHFNKHFLKITGLRPTEYRKQARKVVTMATNEDEYELLNS